MSLKALLACLPLVAVCAHAEPLGESFAGLSLSAGPGRPVCARVTFDPRVAEMGGRVFILDAASPGDERAIRMSEAVIVRRGGLSSRAASSARRHGVPAVSLGQGRWDARGPSLSLDEPTYGSPRVVSGFSYKPVVGSQERTLREGDAVIVDAVSGRLTVIPPDEAQARVDAAQAARAYDGLRDAQALELWVAESADARRASALLEELVARAIEGQMPVSDLARIRRAAERSVPSSARADLRRAETLVFARGARELKRRTEDCTLDAAAASDRRALERLADEIGAAAEGSAGTARLLSLSDAGASSAARACRDLALHRAKSQKGESADFAAAAEAGGARRPEGIDLPSGAWERFVESNSLADWLTRTLEDASLGLRRKSERIRERIVSAQLDATTPGAAAALAAAEGPVLVVGGDAVLKASGRTDVLDRVKDAWAAAWAPGPLGTRLRAGRGLAYDGRLRIEKIIPADASGLAFSRDPGSGRRERLSVSASTGAIDAVLAGDAQMTTYALDRRTGREAAPRSGSDLDVLSPDRLARVARLARALDVWKGAGVEVAFSFVGDRLIALHARALEAPRPIIPLNDPFAPSVDAQLLNVKSVVR